MPGTSNILIQNKVFYCTIEIQPNTMDEKLNNNVNYWLVSFVVIATYGGLVIGDEDYSQIQTNNGTTNCKYLFYMY